MQDLWNLLLDVLGDLKPGIFH